MLIRIQIGLNRKEVRICCNGNDTFRDLKDRVSEQAPFDAHDYSFIFDGEVINFDSTLRLEKAGVFSGDSLGLAPICTSMKFFVNTLTGKTVTMDCSSLDTFYDVKVTFSDKVENQRFLFSGMQLENDKMLLEYNIKRVHCASIHPAKRMLIRQDIHPTTRLGCFGG